MARWFAQNWTRYHSLLEELGRQGHEIHVLQPPPLPGSNETNFREIDVRRMENIVIHDTEINDLIWKRSFPFDKLVKKAYFSLASRKQAKHLIEEYEIDCLLVYNIPQFFYASLKDVSMVFDFADDYIDMLGHELGRLDIAPIRKLAAWMLRRMMLESDLVLSVSHTLARDACGNVHVLANGVDASHLSGTQSEHSEPTNSRFTVGFIGSFEYFIDFDMILDTALRMPDVGFLLVGFGRDFSQVEQRVEAEKINNVTLTGGVPHNEIFDSIDRMDVCLNLFKKIPVSHRACPIKLFEYLSRRKPVISTRLHELEYIDDNEFLYYADTVDELESSISYIRDNREAAAKKAARGSAAVASRYTWQKLALRFIELADQANETRDKEFDLDHRGP